LHRDESLAPSAFARDCEIFVGNNRGEVEQCALGTRGDEPTNEPAIMRHDREPMSIDCRATLGTRCRNP
jgi:hypothetical protein